MSRLKFFALGLLVSLCIQGRSEWFVSVFGGIGNSTPSSNTAPTYGLSLGARYGLVGGEAGFLELPRYHKYATAHNPDRSATQDISGRAVFARAVLQAPMEWRIQPYGFAGAAYVHSNNHEVGSCTSCGASYIPDWHSSTHAMAPYFGGGIRVPLSEHLSARAELGIIPHAIDSYWTDKRDYRIATVGLMWTF